MEGVIVLYNELANIPAPWPLVLAIVLVVCGLFITSLMYVYDELNFIAPLLCAFILSLGVYFAVEYSTNNKQLIQYVAVEDSVSMNDFIERYEILEIKGDMLKVVEKERE